MSRKSVHLMGIGGTGMVSLAGLYQDKGWEVRGSDQKVYPPASLELERLGVKVIEGYSAKNLSPSPDLVVVGNVITRNNPEAQALLASKLSYTSMAQALARNFLAQRRNLVIAGTHGKTTTTSLVAWILESAGRSPGLFVGGIPLNFGHGSRLGEGEPFVIEGDEYDTAFFEKTPKFLHYLPHDAILTSIEFDHADIYSSLEQIVGEFEKFVSILPADGILVANADADIIRRVCTKCVSGEIRWYGFGTAGEWRAGEVVSTVTGISFSVHRGKSLWARVESPLLGKHNVANTVAALALVDGLGVAKEAALEGVRSFKGVRRRQEFVGEARGVRIYDDFAHHPTAIAETLEAFAPMAAATKGRLWAVFEPRSNTVRRRIFQEVLPASFARADEVILAPVFKKSDSLAEKDTLSPEEVAESIRAKGKSARAPKAFDEIVEILAAEVRKGDLVLFMSNGEFSGLPRKLLDRLRASAAPAGA